jgi:uncharacterized protein YodC (DUF2158 family)
MYGRDMDKKFEIGAVVRLKFGGPDMTVRGRSASSGLVTCEWFEGKTVHSEQFNEAALEEVPEAHRKQYAV